MERCDFVNDDIKLIQNTEGLTFGTDALLLAGYVSKNFEYGCEFGSGSGIISMLLLTRKKIKHATALEVQDEYASLTKRNAELNSLSDRLSPVCTDIREFRPEREFDIIYTNPPYMKSNGGRSNNSDKKNIARHEVFGGIDDFCKSAKRMLRYGGTFAVVYRPDRLIDLLCAMRTNSLEPKRMTFVHADTNAEPSMVLVEGKAGGKSALILTKPLIIYSDTEHKNYSSDMNFIMENGSFPIEYKR